MWIVCSRVIVLCSNSSPEWIYYTPLHYHKESVARPAASFIGAQKYSAACQLLVSVERNFVFLYAI